MKFEESLVFNISTYDFVAGDTWLWYESLLDYPTGEYSLKVIMRKGSADAITIESTVSDGQFKLLKTDTGSLAAGQYNYVVKAVDLATDYEKTIDSGVVDVLPNLLTTDPSTYAQQMVAKLRTAYLAMGDSLAVQVSFGDRSVTYNRADLLKELLYWENKAKGPQRMRLFKCKM